MPRLRSRLLPAVILMMAMRTALAAAPSPVGTWRTFNDAGVETGAVTIQDDGGVLSGRVSAIRDPAKAKGLCQNCPGDRKDQPALGLQIIRGVTPDGPQWGGGEILDPETGRVYRVKMRVEDGGTKLVLRGFIGISLFGRSQTWVRAPS